MRKGFFMKRVLSLVLAITLVLSLSSCLLLENGLFIPENDDDKNPVYSNGNTFNVDGGDNYDIDITLNGQNNVVGASKGLLSTVSIYCKFTSGYGFSLKSYSSAGAGVIYKLNKETGEAYIITNYHVVYDANSNTTNKISKDISLYLYGMEATKYAIPAEYVGGSMYYDLAVLKVTASQTLMESVAIEASVANSDDLAILDTAIAIGNPEGLGISATVGYVNRDSEDIAISMATPTGTRTVSLRCIRIDAAVNSGNSGGGLYNDKGELIGIVNAKLSDTTVDNIGYAIPSNVARAVADNIIYYCDGTAKESVYRAIIGIDVAVTELSVDYDENTGKITKKEAVRITGITAGSPASTLFEEGDIINSITIDGKKHEITRLYHVVDTMLDARVGKNVVFNVTRDGVATDVTVPIAESSLEAY